jgi:methyl-accepting chemotaxis protein
MDLSLETATSMEKMTSLIKENAANATKAKQQSHQTIDTASIGKEKVIKTMTSINNIDNFSKKISEIILVMDNKLSKQTYFHLMCCRIGKVW